jgi:7-cyano-7-deazaguanine synthase
VAEIFHGIKSALLFSSDVPVGEYSKEVLKSTIVPNRNAVFASILYAMAVSSGYDSVVFGVHAGDSITYPDCRKEFWSALQVALQSGNESLIQLVTPFIEMSKAEIVASAMKTCRSLSLDFDEVYCNCWSSYDPNHVGQTSTDIERAKAFEANEIPDPFMKASR